MIESPGMLMTIIAFLLVIGPLIFVHELGHYWAGRIFGVKADVFSIGFGREILGWTDRRGTRWKVAWMPLGGYVKFAGDMNPASAPTPEWLSLPAEERNKTFQAKPLWQRFIIVAAGPVTNFILAILIFAGFFLAFGEPRTPPVIQAVMEQSAAAEAGLQPGDRITSVAGRPVERFEDVARIVGIRPGEELAIDLVRGGEAMTVTATPHVDVLRDRFGNTMQRGLLGISPTDRVIEPVPVTHVLGAAGRHTWDVVVMMVDTMGQIITGRRSVKELGGPLKIAQYSGQQAVMGWLPFLEFMAMISINLGFINLLPIPLLDGGHLFFYLLEGIRRRPLPAQAQEWAFRSGLALLLSFMIFVTLNDLGSFGIWERLAGLIG
jgi:regulator of sigma E protease